MALSPLHRFAPARRVTFSTRGFTLIELLVVSAIIAMVSGLMLANNARFGGAITLKNLAYDIALSVRQAQVYGISVARFGDGAGRFDIGYGMHFSEANPRNYVLFADAGVQNGLYDSGGLAGSELVAQTTIDRGYSIVDLCAKPPGGVETCSLSQLDIFFKRPEPDAYISIEGSPLSFNASGNVTSTNLNERARIIIASPRGDCMSVSVEATGQISVTNVPEASLAVCNQD